MTDPAQPKIDAIMLSIGATQTKLADVTASVREMAGDLSRVTSTAQDNSDVLVAMRVDNASIKALAQQASSHTHKHNLTLYNEERGHVVRLASVEQAGRDAAATKKLVLVTLAAVVGQFLWEFLQR
jgi:hypothetical protein